jgi:hypothetical protein
MNVRSLHHSRIIVDERGVSLVIVVIFLPVLILLAAFAIDTANWFTHHSHLQTQADAAALAAAQDFQFPCAPGGAMDEQIAADVHHYDGTQTGAGNYNQQIPSPPAHGNVEHKVISLINASNFFNQLTLGDTISPSPCTAKAIDVKVSETNLPWYLQLVNVNNVNAQARVSILQEASGSGSEPLALPSPAPSTMTAKLIDENNPNGPPIAGPVSLTPTNNGTTWTSTALPVAFTKSTTGAIPVGLRIAIGEGSACGTQLACYDSASSNGIVYTRVWSNSGTPGVGTPPVAPQANDVALTSPSSGGCVSASGTFSNFISTSASCTVQLSATIVFASGAVCGNTPNVALTMSATDSANNTQSPAMTCTGATTQSDGTIKTTWTSGTVSVGPDNPDGPITFSLSWRQQFGIQPGGAKGGEKGNCTAKKACENTFGTVQRAFNAGYSKATTSTSRSGPIIGAAVADEKTGNEVMSVQRGTNENIIISVNVLNLGFQNQDPTAPIAAGSPVTLHTAGSQGTYSIECQGNNGSSFFNTYMATGCPQPFATTTSPNPPICANQPPGPAVCVKQNPGNGKSIEPGINTRINGSKSANTCVNPNHWISTNTLSRVLTQSPPDPRLVQLMIVDSSAWVGVTGSSTETPVRAFATFYITGWSGDPCIGQANGVSNGLSYTTDDNPGNGVSNVLLGHFVKYINDSPTGTGSGSCSESSFGNCIAVLTK